MLDRAAQCYFDFNLYCLLKQFLMNNLGKMLLLDMVYPYIVENALCRSHYSYNYSYNFDDCLCKRNYSNTNYRSTYTRNIFSTTI